MTFKALKIFTAVSLCAASFGCVQTPNNKSAMMTPTPLATPSFVYNASQVGDIQKAIARYIAQHAEPLSKHRPILVQGTIIPVGNVEGHTYRPGTAVLRQLGYLSFEAPDVKVWIDPVPAGCIRSSCTFLANIVTPQQAYLVAVDYL